MRQGQALVLSLIHIYIRPDDLHAHFHLERTQYSLIVARTALHHDLAAQLLRAGGTDDLVQRVFHHADGDVYKRQTLDSASEKP